MISPPASDWAVATRKKNWDSPGSTSSTASPSVSCKVMFKMTSTGSAPSAGNCQPWQFIVITDKALIQQMDEAVWAMINGMYNNYRNDDMVQHMAPMAEATAIGSTSTNNGNTVQATTSAIRRSATLQPARVRCEISTKNRPPSARLRK